MEAGAIFKSGEILGNAILDRGISDAKISETEILEPESTQAVVVIPTTSQVACDVNGNGISDVMFQWTGGDYQVGFWLDGTSKWQSDAVAQPSNWDVIGAKDINSDQYADVLMFGNIDEPGMVAGAYIGYYKNANMRDWVNIGFLTKTAGVTWDVMSGNITGNAGKNSIVWHSKELGALGIWADGTQEWIAIGTGYDANWEMVGIGDLNGDGKDNIIFENAGALYATDIDNNFTTLANFGAEWDVRAVGDFAKDGKKDIILFHEKTGTTVKLNNGYQEGYEVLGQLDAKDWFIVGAGDYNNDQAEDLLVRQYSTGMLGYYQNGDMSRWVEMGRGVDMNWTVIA